MRCVFVRVCLRTLACFYMRASFVCMCVCPGLCKLNTRGGCAARKGRLHVSVSVIMWQYTYRCCDRHNEHSVTVRCHTDKLITLQYITHTHAHTSPHTFMHAHTCTAASYAGCPWPAKGPISRCVHERDLVSVREVCVCVCVCICVCVCVSHLHSEVIVCESTPLVYLDFLDVLHTQRNLAQTWLGAHSGCLLDVLTCLYLHRPTQSHTSSSTGLPNNSGAKPLMIFCGSPSSCVTHTHTDTHTHTHTYYALRREG